MKKITLLLGFLVMAFTVLAYRGNTRRHVARSENQEDSTDVFYKQWVRVDSLLNAQKPKSAEKLVDSIYELANRHHDATLMMKAQLFFLEITSDTSENADAETIRIAASRIISADFPYKAIWQSITAQLYWQYYQANKLDILDRSQINGPDAVDFEQWDATHFLSQITNLYLQSLRSTADLQKINLDPLAPILTIPENTEQLRPTLFDLLAFRALNFFEANENEEVRTSEAFVIDDTIAFASPQIFSKHRFRSADTQSSEWKALQLYQQVLAFHVNDSSKDALIDASLHRLQFVYNHFVPGDQANRYLKALQNIITEYPGNDLTAQVRYQVVELISGKPAAYQYYESKSPKAKTDNKKTDSMLSAIITGYPGTEGCARAWSWLNDLHRKELAFETESVVLPGEPSKILLSYRNIGKAFIRVVRIEDPEYVARRDYQGLKVEYMNLNPVMQFQVDLPGSDDENRHSAEIKIDPLPTGAYCMYISCQPDFSQDSNIISWQFFQSSMLSYISQGNTYQLGYVMNRKTGEPVVGATVLFKSKSNGTGDLTTFSLADGSFSFPFAPNKYVNGYVLITANNDSLYDRFEENTFYRDKSSPVIKSFFFTDRAIYRPGQTVLFKAILANTDSNGRNASVVENKPTDVTLYDRNRVKVKTAHLVTNAFGSVTGSFSIPEGALTGSYRIENESGSTFISVEEYKRQKFRVVFNKMKQDIVLNEAIKVSGRVEALAGSSVSDAQVKYRVTRNAHSVYPWEHYEYSAPAEIARGVTKTDNTGMFDINFNTIPDASVDSSKIREYEYEVKVDVTDVNGETRSSSYSVISGYESLRLRNTIPGLGRPGRFDTLGIFTESLNGEFITARLNVKISRIQPAGQLYRKRLWSAPDEYLMDESTFRKYFPHDEYKNESDCKNRPLAETVYQLTIDTRKDGKTGIPRDTWKQNGWYLIEMSTADKNGAAVADKKYVEIWAKNNTGALEEPIIILPPSQVAEPGASPLVTIASGFDHCAVLKQEQTATGKLISEQQVIDGKPLTWQRDITEADRGGIALCYTIIKDNRIYTRQASIKVPWSNKALDLKWETHRDQLQPGAGDTWTVTIKGNKKEKAAAEMLATLYDASLDEIRRNTLSIRGLYPELRPNFSWNSDFDSKRNLSQSYFNYANPYRVPERKYQDIINTGDVNTWLGGALSGVHYARGSGDYLQVSHRHEAWSSHSNSDADEVRPFSGNAYMRGESMGNSAVVFDPITSAAGPESQGAFAIRKNLQETAFFFPQLLTDDSGNIRFHFTMPEALTEWRFLALAHTKDMAFGNLEGSIKTQKDLMVFPGLPRFLRQGDDLTLTTKISNLSEQQQQGTAFIEIIDARTLQNLNRQFGITDPTTGFSARGGQNTTASWKIHVPENLYEPVQVRISATSGDFTDGEENTLPVIPNRVMVTETLPLHVNGNGESTFRLEPLLHADTSRTLSQYGLTLEYTPNPAWYAIQALPYLLENPGECSEQTFNRYYANALAGHISKISPKIVDVIQKWQQQDTGAIQSNLEKNPELKSALLQETPWVADANSEKEQRHRMARLLDDNRVAASQAATLEKLKELQVSSGGFEWYKGGNRPDRYITQYILTGIGKLLKMDVISNDEIKGLVRSGLTYLDQQIKDDYEALTSNHTDLSAQHINYEEIQYLYMRSFFKNNPVTRSATDACQYYLNQAAAFQASFNPYMRGMIALALFRAGEEKKALEIINSLKELAHHNDEMGMYWSHGNSCFWYEAPVEEQALLIACFNEITHEREDVDAMKLWLLKQKQTQGWHSTIATADACYALLLDGSQWLKNEPEVTIALGNKTVDATNTENGTGYFKTSYDAAAVKPEMGNVKVAVQNNNHGTSWGAVYWQYFENMDRVSRSETGIAVRKKYYISRNGSNGPELLPVTESELKIGDKVTVRIEIIAGRTMDYVDLKDMRPACFEPLHVLSGYHDQGSLGYYESTLDASSHFFINHLQKGKYVFEYPVVVTHSGDFAAGITTLQCMYAPEFSSHSEGGSVVVKE